MAKFLSLTLTTSQETRPFNTYGVTNLEHTLWRNVTFPTYRCTFLTFVSLKLLAVH